MSLSVIILLDPPPAGAALEGFLRFPETTQDFSSTMGVPLFGYNVSRGVHSGLNSGDTGFCFDLKLRKCSEDRFFYFYFLVATKENWRPLQKLCCSVTGNSARRPHRTRPQQTGCLETTQQNL